MEKFIINGKRRIEGEIKLQGAKNSALPILAACVLVEGETVIKNCPQLSDVDSAIAILRHLGCKIQRTDTTLTIDSSQLDGYSVPESLMHEMRSSIIFLGAIIGRMGRADLYMPGGCEIGLRPIDLHLESIKKFGVSVSEEHGRVKFKAEQARLRAPEITLSFPSVGATENIILAACTAEGRTTIYNAAREPEISDLCDFLNSCGARISGGGGSEIVIDGVRRLHSSEHRVIPDRIVGASLLAAAAMTGGRIKINEVIPAHIGPVLPVFRDCGCDISIAADSISLTAPKSLDSIRTVRTMPYPGFPTDMQAQVTALASIARGTGVVIETIFESRFKHISELIRLGARIRVDGRIAIIEGVESLYGAAVRAPDLRGGAALVLAGLAAEGQTQITELRHIDRGYEAMEIVLSSLGADIKRIENNEG